MNDAIYVGLDLGGTKMLAAAFDEQFRPLGRERKRTRGHEGAAVVLKRMIDAIEETLQKAEVNRNRVAAIGFGCPGPLDLEQGVLLDAPNLGWQDLPLKRMLEGEFGCHVEIANDVDLGLYGEFRFGAARGAHCALGVFPGTGIGGACVYEGEIIRGRKSSCMEIGHIQVVPDGRPCGCGRRGCLEAEAGRLAIAADVAVAAHRGQTPRIMQIAGTDLANIRSGALAQAIKAGDKAVENIVAGAARKIGHATAAAVTLLAPDVIVLGGGMVEAMPELFVKHVGEAARSRVMPPFQESFRIIPAELGDDAAVLGAAAWAAHRLR